MCGGGSNTAAQLQAQQQQKWAQEQARKAEQREQERQVNISRGMASIDGQFKQFTPEYYSNIEGKYGDYANPQIDREYANTKDKVRFGLARSGLLDSSAGAKEFADLDVTFDAARTDAAARGKDLAANRRSQVEQNRGSVVSQLYASENPEIALQSAQRATQALNQVPSFEPVSDIIATAAQFASRDYVNRQYGYGGGGIFSPMFSGGSSSSGSGRVIN
jgi:hypothetical protein